MIVAIIQARMGSSRLPGKSMADINGRPMLGHVVGRVQQARHVDKVVVATTVLPADEVIAEFCRGEGVACFRGSPDDVLDRYYQAARIHHAAAVVRITADCPLIDPEVIDQLVSRFLQGDADYVANVILYTYPDGLDVEVFSFASLERAWHEARTPAEREHVTPYLRSADFRTVNVASNRPVPAHQYRWTVDREDDLEFVRRVYAAFAGQALFGFRDVLLWLARNPQATRGLTFTTSHEGYYRSLYQQAKPGRVVTSGLSLDYTKPDAAGEGSPEVSSRLAGYAQTLTDGINTMAGEAGIAESVQCVQQPAGPVLLFHDPEGTDAGVVRALFQQEAARRGIAIADTHHLSAAHDGRAIQRTLEVYAEVIKILAEWLRDPHPAQFLAPGASQPVFKG
jgi:spore coat polysaccharide biosynthesis protein SpsF (cytidylyltransferase family)